MTITLSKEKLNKLLSIFGHFCSPRSGRQTLRRLMQFAGLMAWSYAFAILKPGVVGTPRGDRFRFPQKLDEEVDVDAEPGGPPFLLRRIAESPGLLL